MCPVCFVLCAVGLSCKLDARKHYASLLSHHVLSAFGGAGTDRLLDRGHTSTSTSTTSRAARLTCAALHQDANTTTRGLMLLWLLVCCLVPWGAHHPRGGILYPRRCWSMCHASSLNFGAVRSLFIQKVVKRRFRSEAHCCAMFDDASEPEWASNNRKRTTSSILHAVPATTAFLLRLQCAATSRARLDLTSVSRDHQAHDAATFAVYAFSHISASAQRIHTTDPTRVACGVCTQSAAAVRSSRARDSQSPLERSVCKCRPRPQVAAPLHPPLHSTTFRLLHPLHRSPR